MQRNASVLWYLERSARRMPESLAVIDANSSLTYQQLEQTSKRIGCALMQERVQGESVVVVMEKSCQTLCVMMGALYAGASYVPVDPSVPVDRLEHILRLLDCPVVVTDCLEGEKAEVAASLGKTVITPDSLIGAPINEDALQAVRLAAVETEPAYILFTSGSTGVPKGVAVSHRAIRSFIDVFVPTLGLNEFDRVANQAPFDFDVSVKDIYGSLAVGATLVIVPRELFMQPLPLVSYLKKHQVTVLVWAVAALCIVSAYHVQDQLPSTLRLVAFSGEVMPLKHLASWRKALPTTTFVNLYGPTEITCNCLYHVLDAERDYRDGIPMGEPFAHCGVMVVNDMGEQITAAMPGIEGEVIVRGPSVALGYVGLPEQTQKAFGQNPLHGRFPDRVYHTGDLASFSESGELFFRGRKDNQIKYQGHRVELEEIDLAIERVPGVRRCRCVFDQKRKRLRAFFEGDADEQAIRTYVTESLPVHMRPSTIVLVDEMPLTKNGKVDRAQLLKLHSRRPRTQ